MLVAAKQRNECSKSDASEIQKKAKQRKADRRKPSHPCKAKYQNINAMATVNPKIGFAHPSEQQAQRAISPAPAARVGGRKVEAANPTPIQPSKKANANNAKPI